MRQRGDGRDLCARPHAATLVAERGFESIESKVGAAGRGTLVMSDPRSRRRCGGKARRRARESMNEPMHETFSEMFEQSLANQRIRPA